MEQRPFSNFGWDGSQLLTETELQLVREICNGLTSKEIGLSLGKSHSTIENQIFTILHKLRHQGIHRRIDLIRWGVYLNILQ